MSEAKPFPITKRQVWEAYKRVNANQGGAGVDGQSLAEFAEDLENNLYKLWNRLASGSYMPPPVMRVEIPKAGGVRPLGIPTVADRIAQTVLKQALEPELEKHFHPDSYGYRPDKSAHQAIAAARQRCWRNDWVVDLDIKGFFDAIDHDLLMRAVRHHTSEPWVLLYTERWLKAPVQLPDGRVQSRESGTPQGGVASPLLANLFLHDAFDAWMQRHYPHIPFERYADDGLCHCRSLDEAEDLKAALQRRFAECQLELHPEKTKIVYCKDDDRRGEYPRTSFDFLGYTFRPRRSKNRWGKYFINFSPAISNGAAKAIRREIRRWKLPLRSDKDLEDLARMFRARIQGWINYYGAFYKSALYPILQHLDRKLALWATRKFKRLRRHRRRAEQWLRRIAQRQPGLFPHGRLIHRLAG
ncbi:group II intron reverse transcriptase/maturase [Halochromatium salexigens]|uniref:group II intron reverse transcriptase/maturase n=1 Tax=Halochromatium salexigens TaxID=49447 RepID=UPI0019130508|nr:group II intron reverse transcriptase/maturase [Halochromatium salexigens]